VERIAGPKSITSHGSAEADIVPRLISHAKVGAHPEFIDVEVFPDLWIVEFVSLFVWNRSSNDWDVGDFFSLRQFKCGLRWGRHQ
jgi:hypothetical protein